ncbi:MAG: DUF3592 domain-containing protein [Anaerolineales bacterium]|nr:DUF3592 domain-containing protein [Anaerolineales bacterium]
MKSIFNKQLLGPLASLLFGLLFFAVGSGMTLRQRALEKQGVEAQGVVVGLQENFDSDGSTYAPIVQFKTANGYDVEFVSTYFSSPPAYEAGESVIVVYPPNDPGKAIIKGDGQLFHIVFMLAGGTVAIVSFYLILSSLRGMAFMDPGE